MGGAVFRLSLLAVTLSVYAASVGADAVAPPAAIDQLLAARGYSQGESIQAIRSYQITNWIVLDNQHLVLNTGPARDYLITLTSPCEGLNLSPAIGFSSTEGDLTPLDKLVLRGSPLKTQCPIRQINKLNRIGKN